MFCFTMCGVCEVDDQAIQASSACCVRRWKGTTPDMSTLYLSAMDALHQARPLHVLSCPPCHGQTFQQEGPAPSPSCRL